MIKNKGLQSLVFLFVFNCLIFSSSLANSNDGSCWYQKEINGEAAELCLYGKQALLIPTKNGVINAAHPTKLEVKKKFGERYLLVYSVHFASGAADSEPCGKIKFLENNTKIVLSGNCTGFEGSYFKK